MLSKAIIIAKGNFPTHRIPLSYLKKASHLVCCDGAAEHLVRAGFEPEAIVGDLDSVNPETAARFSDRLYIDTDQEINDLSKAVRWCVKRGYKKVIILGATGKREDHTIGNVSLLVEYAKEIAVSMVTDTGILTPLLKSRRISCFRGQQISIFTIDPDTKITSSGLKYPLDNIRLKNWWRATLNEATGNYFELNFKGGALIVYQKFSD